MTDTYRNDGTFISRLGPHKEKIIQIPLESQREYRRYLILKRGVVTLPEGAIVFSPNPVDISGG